jgi:hypothetical protein
MKKFLVGFAGLTAMLTGLVLAADVGPKADIDGVRTAFAAKWHGGAKILGMHVVGDYALVNWYTDHASGPDAYKRIKDEKWTRISTGGGATNPDLLTQSGIPASIAKQLCSGWPNGTTPC